MNVAALSPADAQVGRGKTNGGKVAIADLCAALGCLGGALHAATPREWGHHTTEVEAGMAELGRDTDAFDECVNAALAGTSARLAEEGSAIHTGETDDDATGSLLPPTEP